MSLFISFMVKALRTHSEIIVKFFSLGGFKISYLLQKEHRVQTGCWV